MKLNSFKTQFNIKIPTKILKLLLSIDVVFILTHVVLIYLIFIRAQFDYSMADPFMINIDSGYPEMFQYLKYFVIILITAYLIIKKQEIGYLSWLILFVLLLLDDALQFHETFGTWAANKFSYHPMLGLRSQDLGELTYVGFFGLILMFFLVFGYLKGNKNYRKTNIDLSILFTLFLFFGVAMDMVDEFVEYNRYSHLILILIEDGGEMITLSLLVYYFLFIVFKPKNNNNYLFQSFIKSEK
jgi:hypothetical protein